MKSAAHIATGSLLASLTSAQIVQWDIERRSNPAPRLKPRAGGSVEEIITNERTRGGYFASCSVGTPPQKLTLQLDTGSSDIWVPASTSEVCQQTSSTSDSGCTFGSFDVDQSSSAALVNQDFDISYVDGSHSIGDYITETFGIGNVELQNTTMGLGLDTDIPYGLVGVGYALNEASVSHTQEIYPNLPIIMRTEGHIQSNAYSLWLNDLDAGKGSILFGGIDTDKYEGDLARVDVQKDAQTTQYTSFTVLLTSLAAHSTSGDDSLSSSTFPIPVVLDSGTTLTYLPQDITEQVWKEVGVEYISIYQNDPAPLIPCALRNNKGYFAFGFGGDGGPVIKVGMDELVVDVFTDDVPFPSGTYKGESACQFGIQNFTGDHYLLGDTFLRSAYVVYDLENNEIGLAATDFNATSSNVMPFPSRGATIPSSTPAPSQNALGSGPSSAPAYKAQSGFMATTSGGSSGSGSGSGSSDGEDSAGSISPALDLTQMVVMGASMGLMLFGGGMFLIF